MFRNFQSDRLEGEFGVFRQLNGGNYYMLADRVCTALKFQRIKLFTKIDVMNHVWHAESNCCTKPLSDEELEALNDCFESTSDLTDIDRSTVYYVAGYICRKENLCQNLNEHSIAQNTATSEFTKELLRGNLSHPPLYLYDLGLYLLVYYKSVTDKS